MISSNARRLGLAGPLWVLALTSLGACALDPDLDAIEGGSAREKQLLAALHVEAANALTAQETQVQGLLNYLDSHPDDAINPEGYSGLVHSAAWRVDKFGRALRHLAATNTRDASGPLLLEQMVEPLYCVLSHLNNDRIDACQSAGLDTPLTRDALAMLLCADVNAMRGDQLGSDVANAVAILQFEVSRWLNLAQVEQGTPTPGTPTPTDWTCLATQKAVFEPWTNPTPWEAIHRQAKAEWDQANADSSSGGALVGRLHNVSLALHTLGGSPIDPVGHGDSNQDGVLDGLEPGATGFVLGRLYEERTGLEAAIHQEFAIHPILALPANQETAACTGIVDVFAESVQDLFTQNRSVAQVILGSADRVGLVKSALRLHQSHVQCAWEQLDGRRDKTGKAIEDLVLAPPILAAALGSLAIAHPDVDEVEWYELIEDAFEDAKRRRIATQVVVGTVGVLGAVAILTGVGPLAAGWFGITLGSSTLSTATAVAWWSGGLASVGQGYLAYRRYVDLQRAALHRGLILEADKLIEYEKARNQFATDLGFVALDAGLVAATSLGKAAGAYTRWRGRLRVEGKMAEMVTLEQGKVIDLIETINPGAGGTVTFNMPNHVYGLPFAAKSAKLRSADLNLPMSVGDLLRKLAESPQTAPLLRRVQADGLPHIGFAEEAHFQALGWSQYDSVAWSQSAGEGAFLIVMLRDADGLTETTALAELAAGLTRTNDLATIRGYGSLPGSAGAKFDLTGALLQPKGFLTQAEGVRLNQVIDQFIANKSAYPHLSTWQDVTIRARIQEAYMEAKSLLRQEAVRRGMLGIGFPEQPSTFWQSHEIPDLWINTGRWNPELHSSDPFVIDDIFATPGTLPDGTFMTNWMDYVVPRNHLNFVEYPFGFFNLTEEAVAGVRAAPTVVGVPPVMRFPASSEMSCYPNDSYGWVKDEQKCWPSCEQLAAELGYDSDHVGCAGYEFWATKPTTFIADFEVNDPDGLFANGALWLGKTRSWDDRFNRSATYDCYYCLLTP